MTVAAQLVTRVVADIGDADKNLDKIGSKSQSTGDKLKGALGHMLGIAGGVTAANLAGQAFGFLKDQVGAVFSAAEQSQQVMAATNAVLKSTHGAAGESAKAIGDLATSLSNMSGTDDEAIQTGENMLLTFTNIGKNTFPAASQSMLDMATAMNHGVQPSAEQLSQTAIQLGKALNDPVQGASALQRVGVSLNDSQKKLIATYMKHGDTAKAQAVILKELQKEFGGAAKASGETAAGKLALFNVKLDNVRETIGTALLPKLADAATAGMNLADRVGNLVSRLGDFAGWLQAHEPVLDILKFVLAGLAIGAAVFVATTIPALVASFVAWAISAGAAALATLAAAAPFIVVGLAIAGLIAVIALLVSHGDQVKAFLGHIKDAVLGFLGGVLGAIGGFVGKALGFFGGFFGGVLGGLGKMIGGFLGLIGHLKDRAIAGVQAIGNGIKGIFQGIWNGILGLIKAAINLIIGDINFFIRMLDAIQIHIPAVGVGPVHTPAFDWNGVGLGTIPLLAEGGIVTRPTLAMIGEAGPEAVVPLNKAGAVGGGMGFGQTIHIHGADANQVLSMLRREALLLRMSGRV